MKPLKVISSIISLALAGSLQAQELAPEFRNFAPTPPLGWNSWDIFGTSITGTQAREQADAMADKLLPAGYDIFTVDIQWYEPGAKGHFYNPEARHSMDGFGRLTPAENRFPSAANGKGFKPLADYVHGKGLRFGIHIMRGIPKQAVEQNLPVKGTSAHAADIAITSSICPWNPDMYGVDASKAEGQAYYDSLIELYASWGVDYIKCDDISRPYDDVQKAEIEALRKAIDKSGRAIVLSLSPGATPLPAGPHVVEHANLWRITDDFWDRWGLLHDMFSRVDAWTPHRRPGNWPDADMIPFGIVEFNRPTHFTPDEHYTLMSLWSIARSPLIFGGDMTRMDEFTLSMLTNPEVLAVNQHSTNNRQVSRDDDLIVWTADVPDSEDKYVALFNARSKESGLRFDLANYASPVIAGEGKSQEIEVDIRGRKRLALFVTDGGNGFEYDHVAWVEPTLSGPKGEMSLTDLKWQEASSGWGAPHVNRTCEDQPLIVAGKEVRGIGSHSTSLITYELPEGYETFRTTGVVTNKGSVVFAVLADEGESQVSVDSLDVTVDFDDLGFGGKAIVRDLWKRENLGEFTGSFSRALPFHGAGLYRLRPVK